MKSHPAPPRLFYGYIIVIVAFVLQAVGWGIFNSMGVFFKPFMDEFGWSRALISSAFSLAMLVCGMSSILQGKLSDRFGPRIVMPLLLNWLMVRYGWRITFLSLGFLCLLTYVCLAQFLVRDPGKKDLLPDNEKRDSLTPNSEPEKGFITEQAVRTMSFWTICLAYILGVFCLATMLLHVVPHVIDMGFSSTSGAQILSTVGAVSILGRFVMGGTADRIGSRAVMVICFGCLSMGLLWLQISDRYWMMVVFAFLHGFAHGGIFAIVAPIIAEYFGTRSYRIYCVRSRPT